MIKEIKKAIVQGIRKIFDKEMKAFLDECSIEINHRKKSHSIMSGSCCGVRPQLVEKFINIIQKMQGEK